MSTTRQVAYHFDYASPYTYLADVLLEREPLPAELDYQPTYLRGLETFASGVPFSAVKLGYLARDVERVARHLAVPFAWPATFPVNGVYALRGALVARQTPQFAEYHRRMFRAAWAESRDVAQVQTVIDVARAAGLEPDWFAAELARPELKTLLRETTDRARERGVFGLPAFFVGDELFWGHDRLDFVRRAITALG